MNLATQVRILAAPFFALLQYNYINFIIYMQTLSNYHMEFFCTFTIIILTLMIIYIKTLSNYHIAYTSDTHTIESLYMLDHNLFVLTWNNNHNRIIYMVTIFFPSHEITITSAKIELNFYSTDTHNRISFTCSESFFPHMK